MVVWFYIFFHYVVVAWSIGVQVIVVQHLLSSSEKVQNHFKPNKLQTNMFIGQPFALHRASSAVLSTRPKWICLQIRTNKIQRFAVLSLSIGEKHWNVETMANAPVSGRQFDAVKCDGHSLAILIWKQKQITFISFTQKCLWIAVVVILYFC